MSKVYVVYEFYNNCEPWEDNFNRTDILKVFDSKEKAIEFIKNYIPDGIITKEEAKAAANKVWDVARKQGYESETEYMYEHYNFIKGIEYPEDASDGSKWIYARNGNMFEDPEYHIYFKEWEVE